MFFSMKQGIVDLLLTRSSLPKKSTSQLNTCRVVACQVLLALAALVLQITPGAGSPFAIRRIRASLVAEATGFITVDLDINMGSRLAYFVWKKKITSGSRHYWVPMTSTTGVIVDQSEWLQGVDGLHLRNTLTYVTVPSDDDWIVHQFALSTDDGLSYTRTLTLPVSRGKNKTTHIVPDGMSMGDYGALRSKNGVNEKEELPSNITFSVTSTSPLTVKVFRYTLHDHKHEQQQSTFPASDSNGDSKIMGVSIADQIYDVTTLYDDNMVSMRSSAVDVFHATHNVNVNDTDNNATTVLTTHITTVHVSLTTVALNDTTAKDGDNTNSKQQELPKRYVARFESPDETLEVFRDAGRSLFAARALRVELDACDPQSQRRPGRFELAADVENCIVCRVAGNPRPEVALYHDGYPLGSWLGHTVYTYCPDRHTTAALLILTQPFSGTFSCVARLDDNDPGTAVNFKIDVPGDVDA